MHAVFAVNDSASSSTVGVRRQHRHFHALVGVMIAATLAVATVPEGVSASEKRCIRAPEHSEIFYEVKDDRLSVRIANMEGECDILFKDIWRAGVRQEIAVGVYQFLSYGNVSLAPGNAAYPYWAAQAKREGRRNHVIRIAPGQIHEFHSDLASVARHVELEGRKHGMPPLPWGKQILVEFSPLTLYVVETDEFTASYGETMEVATGIPSPPMIYRLPERPPA